MALKPSDLDIRRLHLVRLLLALLICSGCYAQGSHGEQNFADLGRCDLESGEAISPCKIGYRTFGVLDANQSNAVLVPMWFTGKTAELAPIVGSGKLLDSTKYFIIAADPFGNGISPSPSNGSGSRSAEFPRFTIRDMVRAQHRLMTEVLRLNHTHALVGMSMGGMQAFEWAVSYPEFSKKVAAIAGSPQVTSYDMLLWETLIRTIELSQECKTCDPVRVYAPLTYLFLNTPAYRVRETPREQFSQFLKSISDDERKDYRPEDLKSQMRAKLTHDVSRAFGGTLETAARRVKSEMLIIVAASDHIQNPEPARRFAQLLAARFVELQSDCGHFFAGCEAERLVTEVNTFLDR